MRKFMTTSRWWGRQDGPAEDWVRPHVLWLPQDQPQVLEYFARLREITEQYPDVIAPIADDDLHMTIQKIHPLTAAGARVDEAMLASAATAAQKELAYLEPFTIEIGPARASGSAGIVDIWPEHGPDLLYRRVRAGLTAAGGRPTYSASSDARLHHQGHRHPRTRRPLGPPRLRHRPPDPAGNPHQRHRLQRVTGVGTPASHSGPPLHLRARPPAAPRPVLTSSGEAAPPHAERPPHQRDGEAIVEKFVPKFQGAPWPDGARVLHVYAVPNLQADLPLARLVSECRGAMSPTRSPRSATARCTAPSRWSPTPPPTRSPRRSATTSSPPCARTWPSPARWRSRPVSDRQPGRGVPGPSPDERLVDLRERVRDAIREVRGPGALLHDGGRHHISLGYAWAEASSDALQTALRGISPSHVPSASARSSCST
ncbi:hypothetical protein ATKI12_9114 [Kitasatospora sp. Ki12]